MISVSATNPCHLYDLAKALHARQALGRYYSGYPGWKLQPPPEFPLVARSSRTLVTYGCLRLPAGLRPPAHRLFRWQDQGFDRAVAASFPGDPAESLHAMPGQARATFAAARAAGRRTVLNHASGPVRQQLALVAEEYARAGIPQAAHHGFDAAYFEREQAEYALAERHCVASRVVRAQLIAEGVPENRIWVVPYAADPRCFFPPSRPARRNPRQIVYAGQLSLRKGLRIALAALAELRQSAAFTLDAYGRVNAEMRAAIAAATHPGARFHGGIDQGRLGEVFRHAGMLVLPSWEDAFGLVVPQALSCGLPCIVSDRVGAADLIVPGVNGSVFPAGDAPALAREIAWWSENSAVFRTSHPSWADCAARLLELSQA